MIEKIESYFVGFTIGLILLPSIFLLILAFGKSKYEFNKLDLKN